MLASTAAQAEKKEEEEEEREDPDGGGPSHDGKGSFVRRVLVDFR